MIITTLSKNRIQFIFAIIILALIPFLLMPVMSASAGSLTPPETRAALPGKAPAADTDLTLAIVAPEAGFPGQPFTYTLTIGNSGVSTATNIVLTNIVPISITMPAYQVDGAVITPTGGADYVWQVADLSPGQNVTITVAGILSGNLPYGYFNYSANITTDDTDTNPGNNNAAAALIVAPDYQSASLSFGGDGDDEAQAAVRNWEGGYLLVGMTDSAGAGGDDGWLVNLNADNSIAWQKTIGGSSNDYIRDVTRTSDGGYMVVGYTDSYGAGNYDGWVVKLDRAGNVVWQKVYGGSYAEYFNAIEETDEGDYLIAGSTRSYGNRFDNLWLIKIDANGTIIWQDAYGDGWNDYDEALALAPAGDGSYIVAGHSESYGTSDYNMWVLKVNSAGTVIWQKIIQDTLSSRQYAYDITPTTDGGYALVGSARSSWHDMWVIKLDDTGSVIWHKALGGISDDAAYAVNAAPDGGLVVAGYTRSYGSASGDNSWVIRLDNAGAIVWQKTLGSGTIRDIMPSGSDGYALIGDTGSAAVSDFFVYHIDDNGEIPGVYCLLAEDSASTATDVTTIIADSTALPIPTTPTIITPTSSIADTAVNTAYMCGGPADIALTIDIFTEDFLSAPGPRAYTGAAITYTLAYLNRGGETATSVTLTDTLPVYITNASFVSSGVPITTVAGAPYVWQMPDLPTGAGGAITITGVLSTSFAPPNPIDNTAIITADVDFNPADNTQTAPLFPYPRLTKYAGSLDVDCSYYLDRHHIVETIDGGYLISCAATLIKFNANGDIMWQKEYADPQGPYDIHALLALADGSFLLAGETSDFGAGADDFWVAKVDGDGIMLWQKTYGGASSDRAYDIVADAEGNYLLVGTTYSYGDGSGELWAVKIDSDGNKLTQRYMGGSGSDSFSAVTAAPDGGFLLVGYTDSYGVGSYDAWVVKLSSNLAVEWQKTYGSSESDVARDVIVTADGGYAITGYTTDGSDSYVLLLKLNSAGDTVWKKKYTIGSDSYSDEYGSRLVSTADGEIAVLGASKITSTVDQYFILKVANDSGATIWAKLFDRDGRNRAHDLVATGDGGYLAITASGRDDGGNTFILSLNADGEVNDTCTLMPAVSVATFNPSISTTSPNATTGTTDPSVRTNSVLVDADTSSPPLDIYCGGSCDIQVDKYGLRTDLTTTGLLPGDELAYTLTITNSGGTLCEDVSLTDTLPVTLTNSSFASAVLLGDPFTFTPVPDSRYVWQTPLLPPGSVSVITVTGVISAPLAPSDVFNTAAITASIDISSGNNVDTVANIVYHNNTPPPPMGNWDSAFYRNDGATKPGSYDKNNLVFYNGDLYSNQRPDAFNTTLLARRDGAGWHGVPELLTGNIYGLSVYSNTLYVYGSSLILEGDPGSYPVVQWDGVSWQGIGAVSPDDYLRVQTLAVADNGDIYVGGAFSNLGGNAAADNIAKWNGTSWIALRSGLNNQVYDITLAANGDLYVGGKFTNAGGNYSADYITRWNGSDWYAVGSGLNSTVTKIRFNSIGDLFVRGYFTNVGSNPDADKIVKLNGSSWEALPGVPDNGGGSLAFDTNDVLYTDIRDDNGTAVAKWNGSSWDTVGYIDGSDYVYQILFDENNDFYVSGTFSIPDPAVNIQYLAHWKNSQWQPVYDPYMLPGNGLNDTVSTVFYADDGTIYIGGTFTNAGNNPEADYVARWMGDHWQAFPGLNGDVRALTFDNNGILYAGGTFQNVGGDPDADGIARWNGSDWEGIGGGHYSGFNAIAFDASNRLYVGGAFVNAGGNASADNIARWTGSSWVALGSGLNSHVYSLAFASDGDLYVGGRFTDAGGNGNADYIARWTGSSWSALGSGLDNTVDAIEMATNGDLYVKGTFTDAGGDPLADSIARWNGGSWSAVGNGLDGSLKDIALDADDNLYALGQFTNVGSNPDINRLVKWDGIAWEALSGGEIPMYSPRHIAMGVNGRVYVGESPRYPNAAASGFAIFTPAGLSVTKSASNLAPNAGDTLTYTIHISNTGLLPATAVVLSDTLPAGQILASPILIDPPGVGTAGDSGTLSTVAYSMTISGAGVVTITIPVTITSGQGATVNSAAATSSQIVDPAIGQVTPVINGFPNGGDNIIAATEDVTVTFNTGNFLYNDPESDLMAGIQLITAPANGSLLCAGVPLNAGADCTVSAGTQELTFLAAADENGAPYATFTFRVKAATGASYSSGSYTMTLNVAAAADLPLSTNGVVTTTEEIGYTFVVSDFAYSDADGDPLAGIQIIAAESFGDLEYAGADVTAGQIYADPSQFTFAPAADGNGTPYATFTFKVQDSSGDFSAAVYQMNINVVSVPDAPLGGSQTITAVEDIAYVFNGSNFPFSDADNDNFAGIQLTTLQSAGALEYNGVPVTLGSVYNDVTQLTFASPLNANGSPYADFGFKVLDSGGLTSTLAYTMTINVAPINDQPLGGNDVITTTEDSVYTFQSSDFSYSDPVEGDLFDGIRLTALESAGDLDCNGTDVIVGTICNDVTQLIFTPAPDGNGSPYADFQFRVLDDGGAVSGAVYTMTLNVMPTADAPTGADGSISTLEDIPHTFAPTDFVFNDADGDGMGGVQISALETAGSLTYAGTAVTLNGVYTDTTQLAFVSATDENGAPYANFQFKLIDATGMTSTLAYTMTIDVTAVNDPPISTNAAITGTEDALFTFNNSDIPFSDPDGHTFDTLIISSLQTAGELECNSIPVALLTICDPADLTFAAPMDDNGFPYAAFGFQVRDSSGQQSGSYVMTINLTDVPDDPLGADGLVTAAQNTPYNFTTNDFAYYDGDDDLLTGLNLLTLPLSGTLTHNGQPVIAAGLYSDVNQFVFTPDTGDIGEPYANFSFQLQDGSGALSVSPYLMTINVQSGLPPTGGNGVVTTTEDIRYTFIFTDFVYSDPDDDPLTGIWFVSAETSGDLQCNNAEVLVGSVCDDIFSLTFDPVPNAFGTPYASFNFRLRDASGFLSDDTYTMGINVTSVNDVPVLYSTAVETATQGIPYVYTIIGADNDIAASLTITNISNLNIPAWLTLTDNGDGTGTLAGTPTNADVGMYGINLALFDENDASDEQEFFLTAVNINDAPVFTSAAVTAATEDVFYGYDIIVSDIDLYDPLIIAAAAPLPDWLSLGDRADGTGTLTGTPKNADVGDYAISLRVTDAAGATAVQNFTLTVADVNEAPIFTSSPVSSAAQGQAYHYAATAEDVDLGELLTFSLSGAPAWLTLTDNGDGTADLNGLPTLNDAGDYPLTLQAADRLGATAVQTFTLTVMNSAPIANADLADTPANTPVEFNLLANDSDAEGNGMTITAVSQPISGTAQLLGGGNMRYTPAPAFIGTETFTYTVSDGQDSGIGSVFVTVYSAPPVAAADAGETISGFPVTLDVLNNDFDPDGDALIVTSIDPLSSQGTILIAADGSSITYIPPTGFFGSESFSYTVQVAGDAAQTDTATATITVRDISAIQSDISVARSSTPYTFPEGEGREILSQIYITNNDPTELAAGVIITDAINAQVLSGNATSGSGSCLLNDDGAVCDLGVILPLQTVLVETSYMVGTIPGLGITSTLDSLTTDPNLTNNVVITAFNVITGRGPRVAGPIYITADTFQFMPSTGNTLGTGNVLIGNHFQLSGAGDAVAFNPQGIAVMTGTLTYVMGDEDVINGRFSMDSAGILQPIQTDSILLNDVGGFASSGITVNSVSLINGRVSGNAPLNINEWGKISAISPIDLAFVMYPGDVFGGAPAAPFTVDYYDDGINGLDITDVNVTLTRAGNAYQLRGSGQMTLNVPGDPIVKNIPVALEPDGRFSGEAGTLSLFIHNGGTLNLYGTVLDNYSLLAEDDAVLDMGNGSYVHFNRPEISDRGLSILHQSFRVSGGITTDVFSLDSVYGRINDFGSQYNFRVTGSELRLLLPQNNRTIVGFNPGGGNGTIFLNVGEATLVLIDPRLEGTALVADKVSWGLPSDMGGRDRPINREIRIETADLSGIPFPSTVKIGGRDGMTANVVSSNFPISNGAYQIELEVLVDAGLPGTPPGGIPGVISAGPEGVSASLEPFSFEVAGYTVEATNGADIQGIMLQVAEAEVAYQAEQAQEDALGLLWETLGVSPDNVQVGDGRARVSLPDICLGKEKENEDGEEECADGPTLKDLQASIIKNTDGSYDLAAQGGMEWPDGEDAPLPGGCAGIYAEVTVSYDPATRRQIMTMIPRGPDAELRLVSTQGGETTVPLTEDALGQTQYIDGQAIPQRRAPSAMPDGIPIPFGPPGLMLTQAYFNLSGCEIPLMAPTGPVFISQFGGGFEFDDGGIIIRITLGVDIKTKPSPTAEVKAPLQINTDSYIFLPKRWIEFNGCELGNLHVQRDPWQYEQELDENFTSVKIPIYEGGCFGSYEFTSLDDGAVGTIVGWGYPDTVTISRFDKYPWFVHAEGEFVYNEETTFATGVLEIDPDGVHMELTSTDEIAQYFELEFSGGLDAWVDQSGEFYLAAFLQASFRITMKMIWDVLPDSGMDFSARIEFGHFRVNGAGKIMGFKGMAEGSVVLVPEVCVGIAGCTDEVAFEFDVGFFIDEDFNVSSGSDIDNYQLVTRGRAQRAYAAAMQAQGLRSADEIFRSQMLTADPDLTFVTSAGKGILSREAVLQELLIDVTVPYTATTRITLQSQAGGPTMTLEGPDATLYDHDKLPAHVNYMEVPAYTAPAGENPVAAQGLGQLRVTHAVADYGAMDALVNGQLVFAGVTFTDTTSYQSFAPGVYTVAFVAAGTTTPVLAQATVNLDAGADATVIATGQSSAMAAWAVADDNSPRAGSSDAYVRLLHAGNGLVPVDLGQRMGRELYVDIGYQGIGDYINMYPMGYTFDIRDNSSSDLLSTLSNIHLEDGGIYTFFLFETISGTVSTLVQDAAAPATFHVVHAAGDEAALEVSLNGDIITDSLAVGGSTTPLYLELGDYQLVISDGVSILISETVSLETAVPYAYVVESSSGTTAGRLISNDQLASYGFVNARLLHLAPSVPDVDVTISYGLGNETPLFSGVGFDELSGQFNVQERITATIVMRLAGTPQVLHTFNDVPLPMGDVLTLYLYEQGGVPRLAAATDASMAVNMLSMYIVEPAEAGNWIVHLHGDVINGDDYELLVDGDKPAPAFSDVEIVDVAGQPTLQWRMNSPIAETGVTLYYKSGSITETTVISQSGQLVTETLAVYNGQTFTSTLTSPGNSGWTGGALQQYPIDISILSNDSYSIYLEGDDLDGGLTRAAAPMPLVVSHTWPTIWNAGLVIADSGFRQVTASWDRFANPEVSQYKLVAISASGLKQEARTGGNGFSPSLSLGNLNPGEVYTFTVQAWDGQDLGRVTVSEPVVQSVAGATFALNGSTNLSVDAGQSISTVITLSTTLDPYPSAVGLYAGPRSDGVAIAFSDDVIVPTAAGVTVTVYITTSQYLPGGTYTATVEARGGGEAHDLLMQSVVTAPYFDLTVTPGVPMMLEEGDTLAMTIGATRYEGHTDEIWFTVQDLPMVDWMVNTTVLSGTVEATLTITDTTLLPHGTYTFTVYADDGRTTDLITRTLVVSKPTYTLSSTAEMITVTGGLSQTTNISLTLGMEGVWNSPITLMFDPLMAPPFTKVGLGANMDALLTTNAPGETVLRIAMQPQTPEGLYLLPVVAESNGRQQTVNLLLKVVPAAIAPVASDNTYTTTQNIPLTGDVIGDNTGAGVDYDGNGDALMAVVDTNVTNGALTLNSNGSFTYTPTLNFNGTDGFTYILSDGVLTDTAVITITVASQATTSALPISLNWNLIGLPLQPLTPLLAQDLLDDLNSQGLACTEIDRWDNGGWDSHIDGLPFNNFEIRMGEGYFVTCNNSGSWTMQGYTLSSSVALSLQASLNLLAIPHSSGYAAQSLLDAINGQGGVCTEVDRWDNGGWDSHIDGLPFNNFTIEGDRGYFVSCSSASSFTP